MIKSSLTASELWKSFNWKKASKKLFRLQRRIYKSDVFGGSFPRKARAAVQRLDKRNARKLQKLILKSKGARMLAIRQVTQLNAGKKTAGVDGKASLTFEERFDLETQISLNHTDWKHQKLREIPIPKKDGTSRLLKVPTISDRAWQCLAKYALEPAHEATFHAQSYGFRTGRSAHDAQKILFLNLSSHANGIDKRVIELDIEKWCDSVEMNHGESP